MARRNPQDESWQVIRRRMIRETETFLDEGLRHPERAAAIPVVRVGSGVFGRGLSEYFWARVLGNEYM